MTPRRGLIETDFPIESVSVASAAEKSIRQEHVSTLQLWWARRPLGVCRSAIFAALCPKPEALEASPRQRAVLDELVPGPLSCRDKLLEVTARLATWEATRDARLLEGARQLLAVPGAAPPRVVDTFAGGGSFPLEALRLGLDTFAGELNPVATVALRAALEYLPGSGARIVDAYREAAMRVEAALPAATERLYGTAARRVLAYFWCRTYSCPACGISVPLMRDRWLARGKRDVAVRLRSGKTRFRFSVVAAPDAEDRRTASQGSVSRRSATCPLCGHVVLTSWLRQRGKEGEIGEQLYAKLLVTEQGEREYAPVTAEDERVAARSCLRAVEGRSLQSVPDVAFDPNGVRHLWAMQYGVTSTRALYNPRQGVALLEVAHEIARALESTGNGRSSEDSRAVAVLLSLTFNRLVMYGTRHAWWQPRGEFPANMFARQAIPMVWNYVEIPPCSPAAAGWKSAQTWIEKVATHLTRIPRRGTVRLGDAASIPLPSASAALFAIDPPYFDSITYAYLADVFYAWMRPTLAAHVPADMLEPLTPKDEEAVVDRRHRLATAPRTAEHFRRKIRASLREARRVLEPDGTLLLMYGHKKAEAWDALLQSVFEAGFVPTASWPIHTERKVKFKHGKVAALSTSCLLVCEPQDALARKDTLSWTEFAWLLTGHLGRLMARFEEGNVLGSDLATSLLAPACALHARVRVLREDGVPLSVRDSLDRLPHLVAALELEAVLSRPALQADPALVRLIRDAPTMGEEEIDREVLQWVQDAASVGDGASPLSVGARYALLLMAGQWKAADDAWDALADEGKRDFRALFRALTVLGSEGSAARQLGDAALGRIGLSARGARSPRRGTA